MTIRAPLLALLLLASCGAAHAAKAGGALVVDLAHGNAGLRSGLAIGDTIQGWRVDGGAAADWRDVDSPFDLMIIDRALAAEGRAELRVRRDAQITVVEVAAGALGVSAWPGGGDETTAAYDALRELPFEAQLDEYRRMAESGDRPAIARAWFWHQISALAYPVGRADVGDDAHGRAMALLQTSPHASREIECAILQRVAEALWQGGKYAEADALLRDAIAAIGDDNPLLAARALNLRGRVASYAGDLDAAEAHSATALEVQQNAAAENLDVAETLHTLGNTAFWTGRTDLAEERFQRALAIRSTLAEGSVDHGRSLVTLGNVAWRRGELDKAEAQFLDAADIHQRAVPGGLLVAGDYTMLGHVAYDKRDFVAAERYYFQSLGITEAKYPGEETVANTLMGLGNAARRQFDLASARSYHERARAIYEDLGARQRLALVLNNLGNVEFDDGNLDRAVEYYEESLEIRRELGASESFLAPLRFNMANVMRRTGRLDESRDMLLEILPEFRTSAPGSLSVQATVFALGEIELAAAELDSAAKYLGEALDIAETIAPRTMYEVEALHRLGKLALARGQTPAARELFERAIAAFESQRELVGGNASRQRDFAAAFEYLYKDLASLLIRLDESAAAFDTIERYRARVLVATILGRAQNVAPTGDRAPDPELVASRQAYDDALAELMRTSAEDSDGVADAKARLDRAREQFEDRSARYRSLEPRRALFEYPEAFGAEELRASLPQGTAVLSYAVVDGTLQLFVLPAGDGEPHHIALGTDANELATDVAHFTDLLRIRNPNPAIETAQRQASARLYDQLLRPADSLLAPGKPLVLLLDGSLHGLPFAALVTNGSEAAVPEYLVERRQMQFVPSLSWLAASAGPAIPRQQGATAVFADPEGSSETPGPGVAARRAGALPPLPAARREAQTIAKLFDETALYIGAEATESNFKALSGSSVDVLHLATHAVVDGNRPLESFLVLAAGQTDDGTTENGLLQAREIVEQMRLPASLVVLSACSTALGKPSAGEGVSGLTSSFFYAGADNVMSTFWPVADDPTSDFMGLFYARLRDGESPAGALRAAQIETIRAARDKRSESRSWLGRLFGRVPDAAPSAPAHWAAFQLYGRNE